MLELVIVFVIGFVLGEFFIAHRMRKALEQLYQNPPLRVIDIPAVAKLKTEKVDGSLLLYDAANTFICQAKTFEELTTLISERTDIKYAAIMHDNKIFTFVEGVMTEKI